MPTRLLKYALVVVALAGLPAHSSAQEGGSCTTCRILTEGPRVLGSISDSTSPWVEFVIAADSRGRIAAAPLVGAASIGIYDADGRFATTIGRAGEGPGEFRYAFDIAFLPGDSLLAIDTRLRRYSVFDETGSYVHGAPLPVVPMGVVPFDSRRFVALSSIDTPDQAGNLFHYIVDREVKRSFGNVVVTPNGGPTQLLRRLGDGGDGTFWSASVSDYHLQLWDTTGTLLRELRPRREWFEPWSQLSAWSTERPNPEIAAVWQDTGGLLWVLIHVPADDWKPDETDAESRPPYAVRRARAFDTLIEVLDPVTGALIHAQRFATTFEGLLMNTPGLVFFRRETETGWIRVQVAFLKLYRGG